MAGGGCRVYASATLARHAPGKPTDPLRVFICDDVAAFRALIRFMLEEDPGIEVVGEAADGLAGIAGVTRTQPDVVLLDLAMPLCDGIEALPRILDAAPGARVVALSGFTADRMAGPLLAQGAAAYVEKGTDLEVIRGAVLGVAGPVVAQAA
jgi:DNA-binding NarL/FixJ family response regulator